MIEDRVLYINDNPPRQSLLLVVVVRADDAVCHESAHALRLHFRPLALLLRHLGLEWQNRQKVVDR